MGSSQSKRFLQALKNSDESTALELYHSVEELRNIEPSRSYGVLKGKVTPLHLAAKRGFKELFKEFLINFGKPNAPDGRGQTVVHLLCRATNGKNPEVDERRAEMLQFLIDFCTDPAKVLSLSDRKEKESRVHHPQLLDLNKQDKAFNTPLHLAAISGLRKCVEILLNHGAVTYLANIAGQTAFSCADAAGNEDVVTLLEAKMVFTISSESSLVDNKPTTLRMESYEGMLQDDLKKMKDELISSTTKALDISQSTAEELLNHFGWSQRLLLDSWLEDPLRCCQKAKVLLPPARQVSLASESTSRQNSIVDNICDICNEASVEGTIPSSEFCHHAFCRNCWEEYLRMKITDRQVMNILCPGYHCEKKLSKETLMELIPADADRKYLRFHIDAFVDSYPNTRWCPYPGCERAVHLPGSDASTPTSSVTSSSSQNPPRAVDCGVGHFFCWACSEEAHDPCSCATWTDWKLRIAKEDVDGTDDAESGVAKLVHRKSTEEWIRKHSKPCPKCKTPIQKRFGCNEMNCSCQHNFCWVCLGPWSRHGSRTGGYFHCNRYRAAKQSQKKLENMMDKAVAENTKHSKKYFKHVYSRYQNHTTSLQYEEELLFSAPEKVQSLVASAFREQQNLLQQEDKEGKFVKDAVRELLKSRLALRSSYALSYYITGDHSHRDAFVRLIAPLERSTEILAAMIARPHLCTPKDKIVLTTIKSREVRRGFLPRAREYNIANIAVLDEEEEEEVEEEEDDWSEFDSDDDFEYDEDDDETDDNDTINGDVEDSDEW